MSEPERVEPPPVERERELAEAVELLKRTLACRLVRALKGDIDNWLDDYDNGRMSQIHFYAGKSWLLLAAFLGSLVGVVANLVQSRWEMALLWAVATTAIAAAGEALNRTRDL